MAYAIFDTPAIHGVLGIKELAQAGSEMVPPLVIATAQLLQLLDDSSVHGHDCLVWIWSTPRNAANHGKQIRRAVYRCDAMEDSDD